MQKWWRKPVFFSERPTNLLSYLKNRKKHEQLLPMLLFLMKLLPMLYIFNNTIVHVLRILMKDKPLYFLTRSRRSYSYRNNSVLRLPSHQADHNNHI